MTAEHSGIDALMAAITDEPLPEEADAASLAEHREATADLAVLREQLDIIGRVLAEPAEPAPASRPAPAPRPVRPVRRRMFRLAVGSLAVAAAASVVAGLGWLVMESGPGGANSSADSAASGAKEAQEDSGGVLFGSPRYLSCAYLVAEGTVTSAEPVGEPTADPALVRVSVHVSRFYKPEKSQEKDVTYVIDENTAPRLRAGDEVLFGVPEKGAPPDMWVVGEQEIALEREWVTRSLPESRSLNCG